MDTDRLEQAHAAARTAAGADQLADLAMMSPSVQAGVGAMREFIGMEVAYATQVTDHCQRFETIDGDAPAFGIGEGAELPLEDTFCARVLSGRLPNLIPDVRGDDRAATVKAGIDAGVGSFVSLPLTFSDGRVYGTLCAASREPQPHLGYRDLQFLRVFARVVADQLEREEMRERTEELQETAHELELQAAASEALMSAVHARDNYTADHSRAVVERAAAVARALGLGEQEVVDVKHVALLHDIGKIAIPDAVLSKEGPLDAAEWQVMRTHPVSSEAMLRGVRGLDHLAPIVRAEHERWDGKGYPDGLAGEQIPEISRITLVCDAYHAMTSDRPYRQAMSERDARREIEAHLGTQFCPRAGRALLDLLEGSR